MRRLGTHHVDIVVSSLERSLPLYRELLEPLGYTDVGEAKGSAESRSGISTAKVSAYVDGYYATFFHDPDGIKLEVVFVP